MGKKSKIAPAQKPPSENQIGISNKFDLFDWIGFRFTIPNKFCFRLGNSKKELIPSKFVSRISMQFLEVKNDIDS